MNQHAFLHTLRRQQSALQQGEVVCGRKPVSRNGVRAPHIFNLGKRRRANGQMALFLGVKTLSKQSAATQWDPEQMWTLFRREKYLSSFYTILTKVSKSLYSAEDIKSCLKQMKDAASATDTDTRVGTLIVATIYLQQIQNRYMFRSLTVLQCSHQHCVQPVASDVEVVGYL